MDVAVRIDEALQRSMRLGVGQCTPPTLAAAAQYTVFPGGARLRPRLCLAVAAACGDPRPRTADAAAASIELLHCASLVHDDLPCFDDAELRRGRPTVHVADGESTAVLCGDALIVLAFHNLAAQAVDGAEMLPRLLILLSQAAGMSDGLCAGQGWEAEPDVALARYHQAKTGSLFAAATIAGALCAGDCRPGWRALGDHIGAAYQVADDLRDLVAGADEIGKPTGQDVAHQRPNAVLELGSKGALQRLREQIELAIAAIPECPGAAALARQITREATAFLPEELSQRVA